jgi:hypothetical protein
MALQVLEVKDGLDSRYLQIPVAVSDWLAGDTSRAQITLDSVAKSSLSELSQKSPNPDAEDNVATALAASLVAQRLGDQKLAEDVLKGLKAHEALMQTPQLAELANVVRAEQLRNAGKPVEAIKLLEPLVTGWERYQTRVALMEAYAAAGNTKEALAQARWLQHRRGLAYIELECGHCLQALNVADSNLALRREAELLRSEGKSKEADRKLEDFSRLWPVEALPAHLREG